MIRLERITKTYGGKKALNSVDLTLDKGKMIGLVGENGSGKTTLMKVIAGLITPSGGKAEVDGIPVTRKIASKIAFMPDIDLFYPYFTVDELFRFYESQYEDFNYDKANIVAQFLNVDRNSQLKKLSKGNRGRAKMAATFGREADYYLLDEPFSGFDPMVRSDIIKGMIQFTDPSQTVFLSTHEIREAEPLLDEIVLLSGGQIVAHKELEAIREQDGMDAVAWMTKIIKEGESVGK